MSMDWLEVMARSEEWDKICPEDPGQCPGWVRLSGEDLRCPAADTTCPHREVRAVEERVRYLASLDFPIDARRPELSQVPDDIREGIELYTGKIAECAERGEGVFALGEVGIGKTCILGLAALAARDAGIAPVEFAHSADLFNALHEKSADRYAKAALLLIDDYGVEYGADWSMAGFHLMMEHRHGFRLATCLTTNADSKKLAADPGIRRILSRLRERNVWLESAAKSQRRVLTLDAWRNDHDGEAEAMNRQDEEEGLG